MALITRAILEKKKLKDNCHIHVFIPGAGADNPLFS